MLPSVFYLAYDRMARAPAGRFVRSPRFSRQPIMLQQVPVNVHVKHQDEEKFSVMSAVRLVQERLASLDFHSRQ